ncbi:MAG: FtsQ-type POTRA domain-containing protein [Desulfovibrionaceae bacterium]|nr:FtsQ-type POTRA domain-containing protein [Desulfovibrionaceae bacterium]
MPLFLKRRRGAQERAGEGEAREAGAARPQPAKPRHVSDRDILAGLAAQSTERARTQLSGLRQNVAADRNVRLPRDPDPAARTGEAVEPPRGNTLIRQPANSASAPSGQAPAGSAGAAQTAEGAQAGPADFEFEPARPPLAARAARRLRTPFFALCGLAFFVGCLAGVYKGSLWLYDWIHTSDTFVTRHIDITGNVRLNRAMILNLAGLEEGANAFSVSVADMERRLRETPWVEDVSVQRILPDRFVIRVQERMPSFWIRRENRLYYANEKGEPIAPVESENFMSLPILTVDPGCEDALPYLARVWKDLRSGALPLEPGAVATVDVSPSRGIDLFFEDREMRLSLSPDDWEGNFARLGVTFGDLARRRELARVQELRAADGRVWVVLRSAAQ